MKNVIRRLNEYFTDLTIEFEWNFFDYVDIVVNDVYFEIYKVYESDLDGYYLDELTSGEPTTINLNTEEYSIEFLGEMYHGINESEFFEVLKKSIEKAANEYE